MCRDLPDSASVHIVDDDLAVRRSLASLLTSAGLDCVTFGSGMEFLSSYCDRGPACIVADIRMPGISGLELIEQARLSGIDHPAIIMTGYGDVATVISAFKHGVVDFFEKPISGSLLLGQVQKSLEADRKARQKRRHRDTIAERLSRLSDRERHVLKLLADGLPNKEIAWRLHLSQKTIAAHRANLLEKMQTPSLAKTLIDVASANLLADLRHTQVAREAKQVAVARIV